MESLFVQREKLFFCNWYLVVVATLHKCKVQFLPNEKRKKSEKYSHKRNSRASPYSIRRREQCKVNTPNDAPDRKKKSSPDHKVKAPTMKIRLKMRIYQRKIDTKK